MRPLRLFMALALALWLTTPAFAQTGYDGHAWRELAQKLEGGVAVDMRLRDGHHFKATFIGAQDAAIVVQRKTRVPVPVEEIPYDAIASLCKLLELLAAVEQPMSKLVAQLPRPTLIHRQVQCPWALKGTVMRVLNERYADGDVDVTDGIKIFDERGWVQVLPDADEPVIHLYAEGESSEVSEELAGELRAIIEDIEQGEAAHART